MVTPFTAEGKVDVESLKRLTRHLIDGGVNYLVVLGSTGEAATQSEEDQDLVIRTVQQVNHGVLPIVLGVGGNDTAAVCQKIKDWTARYKPDAFLSVSPMYNKPSQEGIYRHFAAVAGCTDTPIILYNVPARTGSNMLPATTLRLAREFKNVVAVKEASGNVEQCMEVAKGAPEGFLPISGDDLLALPLMACGYQGVISVVGNAVPKDLTAMVRTALEGNYGEAAKLNYRIMDLVQLCFVEGNPSSVKLGLEVLGICGRSVRLPLVEGSDALKEKMRKALGELGY